MKQIGFISGEDGSVVKYDPKVHSPTIQKPPAALTRHQRATLYFKAVRYIRELFKEVGFTEITLPSHGSFTAEFGRFILDMTVKQSSGINIAYVTSFPGYVYDKDKINANVIRQSVGEPGEYVIQIGAVLPNQRSCRPVFVVVDKDSANPLRDAFMSALEASRQLIQLDPATFDRIREALSKRDLARDFDRISAMDVPGGPETQALLDCGSAEF